MSVALGLMMALATAGTESRLCTAGFQNVAGDAFGVVTLWGDADYVPTRMETVWFRRDGDLTNLAFDPNARTAPPHITQVRFRIPVMSNPRFPVAVTIYVGQNARWVRHVSATDWRWAEKGRRAVRGVALSLGTADDGSDVPVADLRAIAVDATGKAVGEWRLPLPDPSNGNFAKAIALVDAAFLARTCHEPPPPVD
jgi:hypothetical protein